jgi:hypothetical protein
MKRFQVIAVAAMGGIGAAALMAWPASATFEGGGGSRIGQEVTIGGIIDSITNEVSVGGTVGLNSATVSALAEPTCVIGDPYVETATTAPAVYPTSALAGRTQVRIRNLGGTQEVWCRVDPGDGGVPTATRAHVLLPNGDLVDLPARDGDVVRCRSALATSRINVEETSCAQP